MKFYNYRSEGHSYRLEPDFSVTGSGAVRIIGCDMYNTENHYLGYWFRENMPLKLIAALELWVKFGSDDYFTRAKRAREEAEKRKLR